MTGWSELVITESDNILFYSFRLLCLYWILLSSQTRGQSSINDWSTQRGVLSSIRIQHAWQDHRTAKHLSRFTRQRVKYLVEKRATNQCKTMENRQCYCLRKQLLRKFSDKSNLCGGGNLHKFWLLFFQRISPFAMLAYISTVISAENPEQLKRFATNFEFLKKLFDEEGQSTENWNIIGRMTCAKIESRNGYANCQSKDWEIPDNPLTCGIILFSSDWLSYY